MTFCSQRGQFGAEAITYKLVDQRPKFYVQDVLPGFTREELIAACVEAFGRWSQVADIIFTPTNDPNAAQFIVSVHQFDGPLGILADCELPSPGLRPQALRIDPRERWQIADNPSPGYISLLAVLCHEMGHGIGLQHFPAGPPPELMEPVLSSIVRPQATEAAYAAKLYGPPQTTAPPTPVPALGDSLGVEIIINASGARYVARGEARKAA